MSLDGHIHAMANAMISLNYFFEKLEQGIDLSTEKGQRLVASVKAKDLPVLEGALGALRANRDTFTAEIRAQEEAKLATIRQNLEEILEEQRAAYKAKFLADHPNYVPPTV